MRLTEMALISRDTQKKNALDRGQETTEDTRELELGQRAEQWRGAEAKVQSQHGGWRHCLSPAELLEWPQ